MADELSEQDFLQYYQTIQRKAKEQRGVSGEMSAVKKRAKEAGINMTAFDFVGKLGKHDPLERVVILNAVIQYMKSLRQPEAAQMSFLQQFDPTAPPSQENYRAEGYKAYLDLKDPTPEQYDVASAAYQQWIVGYEEARQNVTKSNVELLTAGIKQLDPEDEIPEEVPDFLRPPKEKKQPSLLDVLAPAVKPTKVKTKPKKKAKPVARPKKAVVEEDAPPPPEPEPEPEDHDDNPPAPPEDEEEDLATRLLRRHRGE